MGRKKRYRGHYCWVCESILPNEKFSGGGHARHVCRKCNRLGPERLAALQTIRTHAFDRLYGPFLSLNEDGESSFRWLGGCHAGEDLPPCFGGCPACEPCISYNLWDPCAGEEIVIAGGDHPVVRLVPVVPVERGRMFGAMRGRATAGDAFFESLPSEELAAWEP
ncbi:MAG: hypothetical protein WCJ30_04160 [Deltaproteobacteria bacterium]